MLFFLLLMVPPIEGEDSALVTTGTSTRLTRHLLSRHNPGSPPEGEIIVDYENQLVHIVGLDERKQTVTLLLHVTESWWDGTLSWNPSEFGGLDSTWLPYTSVWIPDIIAFNMLERMDILGTVRSTVSVKSSGRISYSYPQILTLMCPIRIGQFPFDQQNCALEIASWGYGEDKLRIRPEYNAELLLRHYQKNEEWALMNLTVDVVRFSHEENVVTEVRLALRLQRKPLYFITSLLFPTYIICVLCVTGLFSRFSTRQERQERFTLGVTATLTLSVLSLVVTEKVPHTSDEIPLLVLYFHMNTILVTFATMLTAVSMTIAKWDRQYNRKRHPRNWRKIADRLDVCFCIFFLTVLTIPFLSMCYRCSLLSAETSL